MNAYFYLLVKGLLVTTKTIKTLMLRLMLLPYCLLFKECLVVTFLMIMLNIFFFCFVLYFAKDPYPDVF